MSWHILNCWPTLDMFRPSEGLWQEQRMTWRSWVRIWRLQSSCVAPCSRATRSTAQTLTAKKEMSSSCRCAMKMLPTSLMRGESAHRIIKRLDWCITSVQICFLCVNFLKNIQSDMTDRMRHGNLICSAIYVNYDIWENCLNICHSNEFSQRTHFTRSCN